MSVPSGVSSEFRRVVPPAWDTTALSPTLSILIGGVCPKQPTLSTPQPSTMIRGHPEGELWLTYGGHSVRSHLGPHLCFSSPWATVG